MLAELIVTKPPPPNRGGFCSGGVEQHLTEGAVMLAYGMHLLRTTGATRVDLHPDGEHGKIFGFKAWIEAQGFFLSLPSAQPLMAESIERSTAERSRSFRKQALAMW